MQIDDFLKLIKNYTENNVTCDEPHVSLRCMENHITIEEVKKFLLHESEKLIRIVEDRPKVFNIYYKLSKRQELKIVLDTFTYQRLNIRTVKRLVQKHKIGFVRRRF